MSDIKSSKNEYNLLDFVSCDSLDRDLFRGQSKDLNTGQVFGGQVLGQAINAAYHTVDDDREIRSAHAYFLLKGDVEAPIIYSIDRSLDGGSVSSRRVVALQHGHQILHLSSSFQKPEQGLEYQPKITMPVELLDAAIAHGSLNGSVFQANYLDVHYLEGEQRSAPNSVQLWIKTKTRLPDDARAHNSVLAYISDMGLLHSTLVPHDMHNLEDGARFPVMMASIDHAIWFHRPFRADEWFLYDCRVVSTGNGRGLARGSLYDRDGNLFASTAQEGMIRVRRK